MMQRKCYYQKSSIQRVVTSKSLEAVIHQSTEESPVTPPKSPYAEESLAETKTLASSLEDSIDFERKFS